MFVGNGKSDGYYFIIYDKIDEVEPVETSKTVNEEITEGSIESVVDTITKDVTKENTVEGSEN